jgi:hypothetical protein
MFLDIILAVILALLAASIGGLAGHLSATRTWHKFFFWGTSVAMVVLIGIQTTRNELGQAHLQNQLNHIQHNTEQPAKPPIVNVPAPIVKISPPAPAPKAVLKFTFWPAHPSDLTGIINADVVGNVVTVGITAKGMVAQAKDGQIWIQICDLCRYAKEPENSTAPSDEPTVRRKRFDVLHMGSFLEDTVLQIIPPTGVSYFTISLKYGCENCNPVDNEHPQKLRVNLLRP